MDGGSRLSDVMLIMLNFVKGLLVCCCITEFLKGYLYDVKHTHVRI